MKRILTIAGSDSGGGAGIQADLKTITLLGGYGMSVITALTAQNTLGVQDIFEVPAYFVERQMDAVLSDIGVDAVKTGMLVSQEIIEVISNIITQYKIKKLIVDPVMLSKNGAFLLRKEAREAFVRQILPLAWVITPNLMEASVLTGLKVNSLEGMKRAAHQIHALGARHIVVKGGHLRGKPVDLLYNGKTLVEIRGPRIRVKNTHGTGCTFAAAVATQIALGETVEEAVRKAKRFITRAIQSGLDLGKGIGPVNPAFILKDIERRYHTEMGSAQRFTCEPGRGEGGA